MHDTSYLNIRNTPEDATARLANTVADLIAHYEKRARRRRAKDQMKYDESLRAFVGRIANVAMTGRGWLAQSFGHDDLKVRGGPGICLVAIRDGMKAAGLIEVRTGHHDRTSGRGRLTRVRATWRFRALIAKHGFALSGATSPSHTTVLRFAKSPMPAHVIQQDVIVSRFNTFAGDQRLGWAGGITSPEVYLVRKFKGDWSMGGRLYGGFWQELPKEERPSLLIDGEPVVELDFRAMQPRILFGLKGLPLTFDPYRVAGFNLDRETGKLVYNRLVNRKGTAVRACPLNFDPKLTLLFVDRDSFRGFVRGMEQQLEPVSGYIGKDAWGLLQREESELLLSILAECMDRGIPAYPIHDSLIVKASDREAAKSIMLRAFKERYGVDAEVAEQ